MSTCEVAGCRWLPLCQACEESERFAAAEHVWGGAVTSPLIARWEAAGRSPPPEVVVFVEELLAEARAEPVGLPIEETQ